MLSGIQLTNSERAELAMLGNAFIFQMQHQKIFSSIQSKTDLQSVLWTFEPPSREKKVSKWPSENSLVKKEFSANT